MTPGVIAQTAVRFRFAVKSQNRISAFRNLRFDSFVATIEQDDQGLRAVDALKVLDAIRNQVLVLYRQEVHMLFYCLCTTQAETLMRAADSNHLAVVVKEVLPVDLVLPRDDINRIGTLITIVDTFLRAIEFFAAVEEGHTLRHEHGRLREFVHADTVAFRTVLRADFNTIAQAIVIVAGDIAYMLHRFAAPLGASNQSPHHILLARRITGSESRVMVEGTTNQRIADVVTERTYARHLIGPLLHRQFFVWISRRHRGPTLTISENRRIYLIERRANLTHRLLVMDTHQVKTETIDVELACPIAHRLHHKAAHHLVIGSRLIAATRTVGERTVFVHTVEILRNHATERTAVRIVGVVVHHIHHHADTRFMQRLNHRFRFANTAGGIIRIGRITSVRYVIVHRVITPVIAVLVECRFVNRSVVEDRQELNMRDTQFLQVTERFFFRQRQEFTLMLHA